MADFGIASAAGLESFTQTGTILGIAGYLSPEQARGERATAASDRYSLAVVGWELLTGRRPFAAATATAEALAHVRAPVPSPSAANPSLPRQVDPVFERALAKDPAARHATAIEFVSDLRHALDEAAGNTWIAPQPAGARPRGASGRSSRRSWILAAALLLLAGGVGAAVLAVRGPGKATPKTPRTVVRTVTEPGRTVRQTVTAAPVPTPPTTTVSTSTAVASSNDGASLNDSGFARMRAGDYAGAAPLLEPYARAAFSRVKCGITAVAKSSWFLIAIQWGAPPAFTVIPIS